MAPVVGRRWFQRMRAPGVLGATGCGCHFFLVAALTRCVLCARVYVCVYACVFECVLRVLLAWCAGHLSGVCFCACASGVGGGSLLPRAGKWWSPVVSLLAGGGRSPVMYFTASSLACQRYTGGCRLCLHLTPQDRRPYVARLLCVRIIGEYDKEQRYTCSTTQAVVPGRRWCPPALCSTPRRSDRCGAHYSSWAVGVSDSRSRRFLSRHCSPVFSLPFS